MIKKNNQTIDKIYKGSVEIAKIYKGLTLVYENYRDMVVSGNDAINIIKAKANSLNYLKRFGKCEQNGTPTPDIPVDIMCNNGAIKVGSETYTTPLGRTVYGGTLDVTSGVLMVDRAMVDLGTLTWKRTTAYSAPVLYAIVEGKLKSNISMLCSVYKFSGNFGGAGGFAKNSENASIGSCYANEQIFVRDDSYTDTAAFQSAMSGVQLVYELATPQTYQLTPQTVEMIAEWSTFQSNASGNIDITYYANGILKTVSGNPVVITDADGQNAEDVTVHIEPIQSGSGTPSPTNIRPISGMTDINITRLGDVVADGTPEVLTVCGKNLLNPDTFVKNNYISATGVSTPDSASHYSAIIPVVDGKTYVFSGIGASSGAGNKRVHGYDSNGNWVQQLGVASNIGVNVPYSVTVTIPNGITGVRVSTLKLDTKIQFELGSTATAYEPYSAQTASVENLLAVGNYKDEQDIISGEVTKRIGVVVFDGTENWSFTTTPGGTKSRAYVRVDDAVKSSNDLLSNQLSVWDNASSNYPDEWRCFLNTTPVLIIGMPSTITTKDEWKDFLAEQYANGTPVIVLYPLATEVTESVTPQPVNIQKGANTIQVTQASINDLELEIKYKGK